MSGTRSLGLLLLSFVFCAGLALAASAAGISALALSSQTQQKLNPPTVLWNAYPLRQAPRSTSQRASNNKPISTESSKLSTTSPMRTRTSRTETRPTVVHGNRNASQPTSRTGGFPTVLVMTGVIGAVLAATILLAAYAAPARAGGYRRYSGPIKTKPPSRTGKTGRPVPARRKRSRAKPPPTAQPAQIKHPSPAKPSKTQPDTATHPTTGRLSPESPSVEKPSRTEPASPPSISVDESSAAPSPPDERETTDDLLDALRPNTKPAEDREQVSAPASGLRPLKPVDADPHLSAAVRQAPPLHRKVASDQYCEIRLWRGYVKCQLYVEVEGSPGAFVESSFFRLRNPMVPDDRAQRVLADLLADLEHSGWLVVETGPVWYDRRLRRS
jgi:hypothetical protein